MIKEAMFYKMEGDAVKCLLCPTGCVIKEGKRGACFARKNVNDELIAESYGLITSISLDPIEKKPLNRYCPGTRIFSIGSYGCNLHCGFCQNHSISLSGADEDDKDFEMPEVFPITPEIIAAKARELVPYGNIGVAYTYNEPLTGYEFVLDCAKKVRLAEMKNVLVTNGYINRAPFEKLIPYMDAMNIDLKSFETDAYKALGGKVECVKEIIEYASKSCHIEVTTLVIPGYNDSEEEIWRISSWLAGISEEIPLHISKFTPRHKFRYYSPTPKETVLNLAKIASRNLKYVYAGNI